MSGSGWRRAWDILVREVAHGVAAGARQAGHGGKGSDAPRPRRAPDEPAGQGPAPRTGDGRADPGEIVWAWIPYEEDPTRGKDRPALVVRREGPDLVVLPVTSKDHDLDAAQEARAGRFWMDIGAGAWDRSGRPSEVRLDRLVRIAEASVRREGAVLPPELFAEVLSAHDRHR